MLLGDMPESEAGQLLKLVSAVQTINPRLIGDLEASEGSKSGGTIKEGDLARP